MLFHCTRFKSAFRWTFQHSKFAMYFGNVYNKCVVVAEMGERLATIDMGRKLGTVSPFFFGGGAAESPSNTVWPWPRPFVPSGILIHLAVWPQ